MIGCCFLGNFVAAFYIVPFKPLILVISFGISVMSLWKYPQASEGASIVSIIALPRAKIFLKIWLKRNTREVICIIKLNCIPRNVYLH